MTTLSRYDAKNKCYEFDSFPADNKYEVFSITNKYINYLIASPPEDASIATKCLALALKITILAFPLFALITALSDWVVSLFDTREICDTDLPKHEEQVNPVVQENEAQEVLPPRPKLPLKASGSQPLLVRKARGKSDDEMEEKKPIDVSTALTSSLTPQRSTPRIVTRPNIELPLLRAQPPLLESRRNNSSAGSDEKEPFSASAAPLNLNCARPLAPITPWRNLSIQTVARDLSAEEEKEDHFVTPFSTPPSLVELKDVKAASREAGLVDLGVAAENEAEEFMQEELSSLVTSSSCEENQSPSFIDALSSECKIYISSVFKFLNFVSKSH